MENDTNPAETQARRLEIVYQQLAAVLRQPNAVQRLDKPPGETEWSIQQILGHMIEMIPYWLIHCRVLIATTTEPPPFGRALDAPERLAGVQRGATGNPGELLQLLHDEIRTAMSAIRGMSLAERQKKGIHIRRGEMAVADIIEVFIVSHAEEHLAQVRATLGTQAWYGVEAKE